jgi:peptidoglycan hydrolase-like protein with peptidoglycan-binding domain
MSDRGGAVRGLDRADRVAGEHGDKGRDIAETRGNKRGQDVMAMQKALKDNGRDPGTIDGRMGRRTRAALADYQKAHGLKVTGSFDGDTRAKLGI